MKRPTWSDPGWRTGATLLVVTVAWPVAITAGVAAVAARRVRRLLEDITHGS